MRGSTTVRRLELGFFTLGAAAALLYCVFSLSSVFARSTQVPAGASADTDEPVFPRDTLAGVYVAGTADHQQGAVIGSVKIPGLGISAPIVEGVSDSDLRRGVGHVPGSAMAGGLGNVVLAAHRDSIFRPLRGIKQGMAIWLTGQDGVYHYQADSTEVVTPDHLEVMAIDAQPTVTLVTCYPFEFIGSAPKRFVVKAHLVSVTPDAADPRTRRLP